jgi:hypothetical protein
VFLFDAELWLYDGASPWHFLSLPVAVSEEIIEASAGRQRGFGSVRVRVSIGATEWRTSVFPDSKLGTFLLPVKREVRVTEGLEEGDMVLVRLDLVDC